jgi:limonene-1,2-epoxide hydrolase
LLDLAGEHLDSARVERLLSNVALDARYHVLGWWERCVGHRATRAELLKQGTGATNGSFEFMNFASVGQTVLVERPRQFTLIDGHVTLHFVGVFDFDDDGKITSWRDYFDSAEIRAEVGRSVGTDD